MPNQPQVPNPGSDEAVARGCSCPILDNARGRGIFGTPGLFWINQGCPLHGRGQPSAPPEDDHANQTEPTPERCRPA